VAIHLSLNQIGELGAIVYFYLIYKVCSFATSGMGGNLNFHKSHMNFKDIFKAQITEAVVFSLGILGIFLVVMIFSSLFGGAFSSEHFLGDLIRQIPVTSFFISSIVFLFLIALRLTGSLSERTLRFQTQSAHEKLFYFICYLSVLPIILIMSTFWNTSMLTAIGIIIITSIITGIVDRFKENFHLREKTQKVRSMIKIIPFSAVAAVSLIFSFSLLLPFETNQKSSSYAKALTFEAWSSFHPEISLSQFKVLTAVTDRSDADLLYSKATKSIEGVPVEELFDEIGPENLIGFMRYGKPSARDYQYMSDYMIHNIEKWKKDPLAKRFVFDLTEKCPKCFSTDMDRSLLSEKIDYKWPKSIVIEKREIASDSVENETIQ
jgi:hypothetical protein